MQIAKARDWTGAVVYFDAITAFAAMLRALVCHQSSRDHPTSDALMASGFSAEGVATMSREALHAPASEIMLQSVHLRRLLSNTLAATQGCRKWQLREGAPRLANLWRIFVRDRMDDQGLVARLPVCGATPLRLLTMCFLKWRLFTTSAMWTMPRRTRGAQTRRL